MIRNLFSVEGKVWLESETWSAKSSVAIEKDQQVVVCALDGLILEVEPIPEQKANENGPQT